ncbi:MAG: group II intron reverse transcriptase domain-containing protein [Candidatus Aenigmarchaeota archaeon]|nr:group II intron reverse transcriptase domain-containing protein [Candidatus Aenigmarchaeota archaeon]
MDCRNLYNEICSFENLYKAFRKAAKGKFSRQDVQKFLFNYEKELLQLKHELEYFEYNPHPLKKFIIQDPKTRTIHASDFRDRVVHHALVNILQLISEPMFIYDSFANQIGKGTHKALKRFDKFKRKVSNNGAIIRDARYSNQVSGYVLKADIKHYFQTVDHEVLLNILSRKIKDENVIRLVKKILDNHVNKEKGKGMPLGNLTSQFFANVYLNELDQFVKHTVKAKYYIRYVDDFVLLDSSKQVLEEQMKQIDSFLQDKLKLELHPDKSGIFPIYHGTSFLGFRIFYYHKLLKKSNIKHFGRRLETLKQSVNSGTIDKENFEKSVNGWMAYAEWG